MSLQLLSCIRKLMIFLGMINSDTFYIPKFDWNQDESFCNMLGLNYSGLNMCSYDLLEICTNGPKEKLDSTVLSQVPISHSYLVFCVLVSSETGALSCICWFMLFIYEQIVWLYSLCPYQIALFLFKFFSLCPLSFFWQWSHYTYFNLIQKLILFVVHSSHSLNSSIHVCFLLFSNYKLILQLKKECDLLYMFYTLEERSNTNQMKMLQERTTYYNKNLWKYNLHLILQIQYNTEDHLD